ncbi:uncharacterized protein SPPG_02916 [Spizellomyces punctatus DAOM BR117]|uniref:Uncharacterized protein n=1 Tax=Spizellomyces punctatus (strain DAOM BR117) TaxID=645134 RepID=A0A0L0HLY8_SPIPD|nr:uncharacterized protein SPPG_02916 [Spizellomyces punctatus DAOM BR117]KND02451.1 hypothetical protein SPPG_02916 [Spizellomyces punctatus DAOM BR117]|eukprot:XP_016610490.1 hypothetical protein SPPG_02916 [Spizellomyces punctatus DAOM BR117]
MSKPNIDELGGMASRNKDHTHYPPHLQSHLTTDERGVMIGNEDPSSKPKATSNPEEVNTAFASKPLEQALPPQHAGTIDELGGMASHNVKHTHYPPHLQSRIGVPTMTGAVRQEHPVSQEVEEESVVDAL